MSIHEHHIIPISLNGPNWKENVIYIPKRGHEIIHQVLNIPYAMLRKFRKKTNHIPYWNSVFIKELIDVQNLYFARITSLPKSLLKKHCDAFKKISERACKEYKIDVALKINPYLFNKENLHFMYWKEVYHEILKELALRQEKQRKNEDY